MIELLKISSYKTLIIGVCFLGFIISVNLLFSVRMYLDATSTPFVNLSIMSNKCEYKNEIVNDRHLKCDPKRKVAFQKTHKCASTTIQNLLLRFGRANNLNFVLPPKKSPLNQSIPFKRSMIKETLWEKVGLEYDIFLLHSMWNQKEIANTLSDHGDVFYFSFIRDPAVRFRSRWDYNSLDRKYNKTIEEYALAASKETNITMQKRMIGFNQILHDFGFPYEAMHDRVKIEDKIKEIDETFDLILLADYDYFNDSIILLKDALCWEYKDMINFQLNSKNEKLVTSLSPRAYQALKEWLWADNLLYEYFKNKFLKQRKVFGLQKLKHEKRILKQATDKVKERCIEAKVENKRLKKKDRLLGKQCYKNSRNEVQCLRNDVMGYRLRQNSDEDCPYYTMEARHFRNEVRSIQLKKSIAKMRKHTDKKKPRDVTIRNL